MAHKQVYTRLFSLCLVCLLPSIVVGYPNGAISAACSDLIPHHAGTSQTEPPYRVMINADKLEKGVPITGTLEGMNGAMFKGFILQARCTSCSPERIIGGTFSSTSQNVGALQCNSAVQNTLVHTAPGLKQNVQFTWTPPVDLNLQEGLKFKATVVQSYAIWWSEIVSKSLTAVSGASGTLTSTGAGDGTGGTGTTNVSGDGTGGTRNSSARRTGTGRMIRPNPRDRSALMCRNWRSNWRRDWVWWRRCLRRMFGRRI